MALLRFPLPGASLYLISPVSSPVLGKGGTSDECHIKHQWRLENTALKSSPPCKELIIYKPSVNKERNHRDKVARHLFMHR